MRTDLENGTRVVVRKTGETAVFIKYQRFPETWWGGRPDPPRWTAVIEYPHGSFDLVEIDAIEPLERPGTQLRLMEDSNDR